jgi:hypothetical protein
MAANWAAGVAGKERAGEFRQATPLKRTALSTQKKQRYSLNSNRFAPVP